MSNSANVDLDSNVDSDSNVEYQPSQLGQLNSDSQQFQPSQLGQLNSDSQQPQNKTHYTLSGRGQQQLAQQSEQITRDLENITDSKNVTKNLGIPTIRYIQNLKLEDNPKNNALLKFIQKYEQNSQAYYGLKDFKELFKDEEGKDQFKHFITHACLISYLKSNKIEVVGDKIIYIEQYTAGVNNPEKFKGNRHYSQMNIRKQKKLNNHNE